MLHALNCLNVLAASSTPPHDLGDLHYIINQVEWFYGGMFAFASLFFSLFAGYFGYWKPRKKFLALRSRINQLDDKTKAAEIRINSAIQTAINDLKVKSESALHSVEQARGHISQLQQATLSTMRALTTTAGLAGNSFTSHLFIAAENYGLHAEWYDEDRKYIDGGMLHIYAAVYYAFSSASQRSFKPMQELRAAVSKDDSAPTELDNRSVALEELLERSDQACAKEINAARLSLSRAGEHAPDSGPAIPLLNSSKDPEYIEFITKFIKSNKDPAFAEHREIMQEFLNIMEPQTKSPTSAQAANSHITEARN